MLSMQVKRSAYSAFFVFCQAFYYAVSGVIFISACASFSLPTLYACAMVVYMIKAEYMVIAGKRNGMRQAKIRVAPMI